MNVIRAKKAGFCMGVGMALRKLDKAVAGMPRGQVATLGAIIHNPQVLEDYAAKGVQRLERPEEARPGMAVVIRAHGIAREDEARLRASGVMVVDATCPRVKKAQLAIAKATATSTSAGTGASLLLLGEAEHPEVRGLVSYAGGECRVFATPEELKLLLPDGRPAGEGNFVLAAQTTQDRQLFESLRQGLAAAMGDRLTVLDTICDATRERQEEALLLAGMADAMVVVGGRESGNTRRLADISRSCGVPTLHVETEDELDPAFFAGAETVGLTAGASTPKRRIDAVERRLLALAGNGA